eukprot:NODE_13302_length_1173_cov_4.955067.p1 GENE.NODE_13302_length_1173_cov_4.955067~~NODE_13302_length_1173_cov_4.955067.p1  ORF type:complete len:330 (+),score=106.52 NODE_13302_length_1173_cov_4.955067:95-991(+)
MAQAVLILVLALFVVPKLMTLIPDVDPLMMIIGVFVMLAALQQMGFQMGAQGEDSRPGGRDGRGADGGSTGRRGATPESERLAQGPIKVLREAERCFDNNNSARACELAKEVLELDPELARAWEVLAMAQKEEGLREEASATVRKARELHQVDSKKLQMLARELDAGRTPEDIAKEFEVKGEGFFGRRQYDLAADCYAKALEAMGTSSVGSVSRLQIVRRRCDCAQQLQDWGTCRRDATELLAADPQDTHVLLQRAASNEALEKFKDALDDARQLLLIEPRNAAANRIANSCKHALRD